MFLCACNCALLNQNPFFLSQLLNPFHEMSLLWLDFASGWWRWELGAIKLASISADRDVFDIAVEQMREAGRRRAATAQARGVQWHSLRRAYPPDHGADGGDRVVTNKLSVCRCNRRVGARRVSRLTIRRSNGWMAVRIGMATHAGSIHEDNRSNLQLGPN